MRRSIRWTDGRGFQCCAFLCVGLIAAQTASADSNGRSTSEASRDREQIQTPMTGKGVGVAPYSVRLRITGFLARQHAREGDSHRALVEYHSMLNVDDPAWPDNEQGDSMRIARDIEVAQMMSESDFYDHAIRVLQTTLILARVNKDPQAVVVERQMLATAELAEIKGVAVPPVELSYADVDMNMPQLNAVETPHVASTEAGMPVLPASSELPPEVAQPKAQSSAPISGSLPELPPSTPHQVQFQATAKAQVKIDPKEKPRLSKLLPWRRRFAIGTVTESTMPATDPQIRPTTSPDVSPTYCPECAGLHHRSFPHPGSAIGASPRVTQVGTGVQPTSPIAKESQNSMNPASSGEPQTTVRSKILGKKLYGDSHDQTVVLSESSRKAGPALEPPVVTESTASHTRLSKESGPQLAPTPLDRRSIRQTAQQDPSEPELNDVGPSLQPSYTSEIGGSNETVQESTSEPVTSNPSGQVGVAGLVPNPGIFTFEGTSTTLAALLRRTGKASNDSIKQTRILRSVDLHRVADSADPLRDFYCQRIEVVQPTGDELDTPVFGQEVVIVDGAGQKPIYVAVMPHFILQVPHNASHPVTADQIVDQLRVYWPNIRKQEIGVVRYEQWSRASKIARLKDADVSFEAPMRGGDVLYLDGLSLDHSQVLSAAEAIARLAGVKIRSAESSVQPTAGSSD